MRRMQTTKPLAAILAVLAAGPGGAWAAEGDEHARHRGMAREPAASAWSSAPLLLPAGRPVRGQARLQPFNLSAASVDVIGPAAPGQAVSVPVVDGVAAIAPSDPKTGNYHWVFAREHRPGEERLASTAWYVSNPGPAPTRLLAEPPPGLVVVPRLPREHGSYREGEKWDFALRFDGRPVPGAVLALETEFGTRTRAVAGQDGVATLVFPRDFEPARLAGGEHGGRASARFVVAAELERGGIRHVSAFNAAYAPDPARSRDLLAGAGFLLLGMAAATPLLRRRQEEQ